MAPRKTPHTTPSQPRKRPGKVANPAVGPVGQRLELLMLRADISQAELARRTGLKQSRISELLAGRRRFAKQAHLASLAEALGAPADALTRGLGLVPIRVQLPGGQLGDGFDLAELEGRT